MGLRKKIPCFLMPPLCAGLYLAVSRTGLFFRIYVALFGWDEIGAGMSILCFPILALLCGILPAVLLTGRDHSVWTAWAALFFALFFLFEVMDQIGFPPDPPFFFILWIPASLFAFLFHLLPSWIASAVRAIRMKQRNRGNAFS